MYNVAIERHDIILSLGDALRTQDKYIEHLESKLKIQDAKANKIADKMEKLLNGNK